MDVLKTILMVLLDIFAIVLIVIVLMQQSKQAGLGAIAGGAETFFGKSKAKSWEGKLALLTKVCACVFVALTIILLVAF